MYICSENGCEKPVNARCLCSMHYMRLRRDGLIPVGTRARGTLEERFWRYVDKSGECWTWTGRSVNNGGYGQIQVGGKGSKHVLAHRLSYELHHGHIPEGLVVMHSCDNRLCVNPDHLSVGTYSENTLDAINKGRWIQKAPPVFKGSAHHKAKINEEQAKYIRTCGRRTDELALEFGLSKTTVIRIKSGKLWSHI